MWGFFHGWKYSLNNGCFKRIIFRVFENYFAGIEYKYTPTDTGLPVFLPVVQAYCKSSN